MRFRKGFDIEPRPSSRVSFILVTFCPSTVHPADPPPLAWIPILQFSLAESA